MDTDGVLTKPCHLPVPQQVFLILIIQIPLGIQRCMGNKKPAWPVIEEDGVGVLIDQGEAFQPFPPLIPIQPRLIFRLPPTH